MSVLGLIFARKIETLRFELSLSGVSNQRLTLFPPKGNQRMTGSLAMQNEPSTERQIYMHNLIQLPSLTVSTGIWVHSSTWPHRVLIMCTIACLALSPQARAACNQGCDANDNTFLGEGVL